jgi:hypothetical protein
VARTNPSNHVRQLNLKSPCKSPAGGSSRSTHRRNPWTFGRISGYETKDQPAATIGRSSPHKQGSRCADGLRECERCRIAHHPRTALRDVTEYVIVAWPDAGVRSGELSRPSVINAPNVEFIDIGWLSPPGRVSERTGLDPYPIS